jgi:hypothetical protein
MPLDHHRLKQGLPIEPGRWHETHYEMEDIQRRRFLSNYERMADLFDFYLIGDITFDDENGVSRRIGFCRRYDSRNKRFDIWNDPNYEYAD